MPTAPDKKIPKLVLLMLLLVTVFESGWPQSMILGDLEFPFIINYLGYQFSINKPRLSVALLTPLFSSLSARQTLLAFLFSACSFFIAGTELRRGDSLHKH